MTIELEVPAGLEALLEEEAARAGQEPAEFVRELLRRQLVARELEALKHRKPPQSLDEIQPRVPPPPGKSWLEGVVGQWPGDESDEEVFRALDEMS